MQKSSERIMPINPPGAIVTEWLVESGVLPASDLGQESTRFRLLLTDGRKPRRAPASMEQLLSGEDGARPLQAPKVRVANTNGSKKKAAPTARDADISHSVSHPDDGILVEYVLDGV